MIPSGQLSERTGSGTRSASTSLFVEQETSPCVRRPSQTQDSADASGKAAFDVQVWEDDDAPSDAKDGRSEGGASGLLLKQPLKMKATVWASSLNMINNVVGAGLFSMPWAMKRASIAGGIMLCLFTCVVNSLCYYVLAQACDMSGAYTYLDLGTRCFGPRFGVFSQVCVLFYSLGSCLSFVVLVGDFLAGDTGVFGGTRESVIFVVSVCIFLPLSLLRNTESLKWTSLVSFFACIGAAILVVATSVTRPPEAFITADAATKEVQVRMFEVGPSAWAAVPIMNVAFTAHYNAPRFYLELQDRSPGRFLMVVAMAMSFSAVVYGSVGACGYATFGEETQGSILLNYAPSWRVAVAARLLLALVVIFTFPLANHAVRDSLLGLFSLGRVTTNNAPNHLFVSLTIVLVGAITVCGVAFTKIENILALKGALFGTLVVYVIPPFIYGKLLLLQQRASEAGAPTSPTSAATSLVSPSGFKVSIADIVRAMGPLALLPLWGITTCVLSLNSLASRA